MEPTLAKPITPAVFVEYLREHRATRSLADEIVQALLVRGHSGPVQPDANNRGSLRRAS